MNYTELEDALKSYLESMEPTFVGYIPTFVRQAEQRIYRSVAIPEFRTVTTTATVPGVPTIDRPSDFLAPVSVAVILTTGDYAPLLEKDVTYVREAYPNPTTTGVPRVYAQGAGDAGLDPGEFLLGPTPDAVYPVEVRYYRDPPSIVDAGSSWLGDNAATALLYGSLVEAYTFLKGDQDLISEYKSRYVEAMGLLSTLARGIRSDAYRSGEGRV